MEANDKIKPLFGLKSVQCISEKGQKIMPL